MEGPVVAITDPRADDVRELKQLGRDHAEIKSMHVRDTARGTGVARAVLSLTDPT